LSILNKQLFNSLLSNLVLASSNSEQDIKRSLSPDSDGEASNKKQKTDAETSLLDDFADTSCEMPTYIDED